MNKKDALTKGSSKLQTSYFRARQRLEGMDNFAFFTVYKLNSKTFSKYSLALVHLIPSFLVWEEIKFMVHVAMAQRPMNQLKPVQQSRQQALISYCPNIYTVPFLHENTCSTPSRSPMAT